MTYKDFQADVKRAFPFVKSVVFDKTKSTYIAYVGERITVTASVQSMVAHQYYNNEFRGVI